MDIRGGISVRWAPILLTILLAGCFSSGGSDPEVDDGPEDDRGDVGDVAWAVTTLGSKNGGSEPSIKAGPDGTLYVASGLALWRSDDGGATWTALGRTTCPNDLPMCPGLEEHQSDLEGPGDADLWIGPDGRVHWVGLHGPATWVPYFVSDDRGESFDGPFDLADNEEGDRQWISGVGDTIHVLWRDFPEAREDRRVVLRTSYDGGATWGPRVNITTDARTGPIAIDPVTGSLAMGYDKEGDIGVAVSMDGGKTWEDRPFATFPLRGHIFPIVTFDRAGHLYLTYAVDLDGLLGTTVPQPEDDQAREAPDVYLVHSGDLGGNWSEPRRLNADGTSGWFPWVAAGDAGRVVVAWYQNDRGYARQLSDVVHVQAAISVEADRDGEFVVSRVMAENHIGPECRASLGCTRSLLDFFEVTIHPQGYPVMAFASDIWISERTTVMAARMTDGPSFLAS